MYTKQDVIALEEFFKTVELPKEIELLPAQKVINVERFIKRQVAVLTAYPESKTFEAAFARFVRLKDLLLNGQASLSK